MLDKSWRYDGAKVDQIREDLHVYRENNYEGYRYDELLEDSEVRFRKVGKKPINPVARATGCCMQLGLNLPSRSSQKRRR
jgi:hypothetical protein